MHIGGEDKGNAFGETTEVAQEAKHGAQMARAKLTFRTVMSVEIYCVVEEAKRKWHHAQ